MKKRGALVSLVGYIGFFFMTALIITAGMLIYGAVSAESQENKLVIAGVMFAVIVVLAFIFTLIDYLRRKFTVERPVEAILNGVQRIAAGDFSVRLQPSHSIDNYNEFDTIMEHINTLAAELSKVEVFRSDFIANVSHEIKTPLTVIQNYATALQGDLPVDVRVEYTKTLVIAAKRLTSLITNILKLNKLENQEIVPEFATVDVGELLRERLLELVDVFDQKNIVLDCDIDDVQMRADESFLEIVWNNLLSNAVKFTPEGGSIFVSLKDGGRTIEFTVRDTGIGMDSETGARIFDKFYQGDTSHSTEGNGLGLTLVKKVVDILGGEISVKSKRGEGSEFTVILHK